MTDPHSGRGPGVHLAPGPHLTLVVEDVTRRYGSQRALGGVGFRAEPGAIRAIIGPNGAGKTTLLRILSGLTGPTTGAVWFERGGARIPGGWSARRLVGIVPAGDRSFYHRLSGLENLVFFGRLHGMRRQEARSDAAALLDLVGLGEAARKPVGRYSQGMAKRLSIARAFLTRPAVLLLDEATHDLDPLGSELVRGLVRGAADEGAVVVWATQRLEEIRGFADAVTLLDTGTVRFEGSVDQLLARAPRSRYVLRLGPAAPDLARRAATSLDGCATVVPSADSEHVGVGLLPGVSLGAAVARLVGDGLDVISCREQRSEVEGAFLALTGQASA